MLTIDLDDSTPLYLQVSQGIQRAIAGGALRVGAKLPSVRQLAGDLAINLNTVARAYRQLEEQGLVRVRQGRGARVASDLVSGDRSAAEADLRRSLAQVFSEARLAGLDRMVVERAARACLDDLEATKERK